ncbi:hypothetical protein HF325_001185 [Metschnikowia pulcherrima]|uniref:Uncharacterized protein n=1 Tax=Metschnikowia pulcherrima TaxID=27326 RepID=A0A8H7GVJ4_9ASCO|nr:hypothetical protein HF325_001185 [Metschnikowia pulcherrima]
MSKEKNAGIVGLFRCVLMWISTIEGGADAGLERFKCVVRGSSHLIALVVGPNDFTAMGETTSLLLK